MLIKGKNLTTYQRDLVRRVFVNRFTGEHKPSWVNTRMPNGDEYKPMYATDNLWIDAHAFYFVKDGSRLMENRKHCEPEYMAD